MVVKVKKSSIYSVLKFWECSKDVFEGILCRFCFETNRVTFIATRYRISFFMYCLILALFFEKINNNIVQKILTIWETNIILCNDKQLM